MEKSQFSMNISLYLGNNTRQGHNDYGSQIGTSMRNLLNGAISGDPELNADLQVLPLFDAEYLRNGTR